MYLTPFFLIRSLAAAICPNYYAERHVRSLALGQEDEV
jgi:hypothetical protein